MKIIFFAFFLFISSVIQAKEKTKIFKSFDSDFEAVVVVSPTDTKNYYLIDFIGFEKQSDNTFLYVKVKNDLGSGFHYKLAGLNEINLRNDNNKTLIYGSWVPYYTVYLDRNTVVNVLYAGLADINVKRKIKSKYLAKQGLGISKLSAKKKIKKAISKVSEICKHDFKVNIDWTTFEDKNQKSTPGMLYSYLGALGNICLLDEDYLDAVQDIHTINVQLSNDKGKHSADLKEGTLQLQIDKDVPNLIENGYETILKIF